MAISICIKTALISILLLYPSTSSPIDHETQLLELKIKAITSVELSSMSFDEIPSLFFLYENLVTKRFESIHKKGNPQKFEGFRKIHQYHAIKNSFYSLKMRDIMIIDSFNAEELDVMSNKVNWTVDEVTSYEFLGKLKEIPKYQFIKKELDFHEPAMADFFITQYFYDNLYHPKDNPTDDEMELRIRFFLYATADHYDTKFLTNKFILDMIEDQNGELFSDQVRMIMKYRFKFLLDAFLPDRLDRIEKVSKMFAKDEEILKNLWRIDDNQPYYLGYFRYLTTNDKVYKLKDIADKFFTTDANVTSKLLAENIFRGRNQIMSVLYRIYEKKDQNFTQDILNVTKYEVSDEILTQLSQEKNFLDFVDSSSYSVAEKREFYYANSYNLISIGRNSTGLLKFWHRLEKYFNNEELKWFITQKEIGSNTTQLFLVTSHDDISYVQTFLNLTEFYLNEAEIQDFLVQKRPVGKESFITRFIRIVRKAEVLELTYNFAKEHLSHQELKELIFGDKNRNFILKMSGNKAVFKLCMKIASEFYTKEEIQDMLMENDEYGSNIIFNMVGIGYSYGKRDDFADYLKEFFKDDQDKLKKLLRARDSIGQTALGRYSESYYKDGVEPLLELAKKVFTADEIKELYERKMVEQK